MNLNGLASTHQAQVVPEIAQRESHSPLMQRLSRVAELWLSLYANAHGRAAHVGESDLVWCGE